MHLKYNKFKISTVDAKYLSIKGIVSRDFGTLFLISLDRFEGRNRAGAGLFLI
jgi:hypothetical protein